LEAASSDDWTFGQVLDSARRPLQSFGLRPRPVRAASRPIAGRGEKSPDRKAPRTALDDRSSAIDTNVRRRGLAILAWSQNSAGRPHRRNRTVNITKARRRAVRTEHQPLPLDSVQMPRARPCSSGPSPRRMTRKVSAASSQSGWIPIGGVEDRFGSTAFAIDKSSRGRWISTTRSARVFSSSSLDS